MGSALPVGLILDGDLGDSQVTTIYHPHSDSPRSGGGPTPFRLGRYDTDRFSCTTWGAGCTAIPWRDYYRPGRRHKIHTIAGSDTCCRLLDGGC